MYTFIIISSVIIAVMFIWILREGPDEHQEDESVFTPNLTVESNNSVKLDCIDQEKNVSLPRQYRRAQQSLARQRSTFISNMKEMAYQGQVLDIQSLIVGVSSQQVTLQDAMISLQQKDLDLTSKQNEIQLVTREGLLDINEARNKLKTETIDSHRLKAENEIKNTLLFLEESKISLKEREVDLNFKEKDLSLKSQVVELKGKSINLQMQELGIKEKNIEVTRATVKNELVQIEIKGIGNKLDYQDQVNQLNKLGQELKKRELYNERGELINISRGIDLQKKGINLDLREGMLNAENKTLDNKKGELNNLIGRLNNKENSLRLSERELRAVYSELSQEYRVLLNTVRIESQDLMLDRKMNRITNKEEFLQLREQKLNNLSGYIDQMYKTKSEWLKIESKGNDLSYREQKLNLDGQYFRTKKDLDHLQLIRFENGLLHREQKLELNNLVSSLQKEWYW